MVLGVAHENGYGNPLLCPKMTMMIIDGVSTQFKLQEGSSVERKSKPRK